MAPGQIEISVEPFDFRDESAAEFALAVELMTTYRFDMGLAKLYCGSRYSYSWSKRAKCARNLYAQPFQPCD